MVGDQEPMPEDGMYWTFIGVAATCSFFKNTQTWGRTER